MKTIHALISYVALLLLSVRVAPANPIHGAISIDEWSVSGDAEQLDVAIDFSLTPLKMRANERVVITPVVQGESGEELSLPDIVVGRRGGLIAHLREVEPLRGEGLWSEPQLMIPARRRGGGEASYRVSVDSAPWMQSGDLLLYSLYVNCRDRVAGELLASMLRDRDVVQQLEVEPMELPQQRTTTSLSLLFERGAARVDIDYASNGEVMVALDSLLNGGGVRLVSVTGYASPQGDESLNNLLSKHRALDVEALLKGCYPSLDNVSTLWQGEDWGELRREVSLSEIPYSRAILSIIDSSTKDNLRERELEAMGAEEYDYIVNQFYPPLQRVEVVVIK
ncbi:MAG: DUF3868 domain-containing protein [Rikenellaceae bacterium]